MDALANACLEVGLGVTPEPAGTSADLGLVAPSAGGTMVGIDVATVEFAGLDWATRLRNRGAHGTRALVVVADRVTASAQEYLRQEHLSWLDRRGHLHLELPGVFVDSDVTPATPVGATREDGIRGRGGLAYAVACLLAPPGAPPSIRGVARHAGLTPSVISEAAASLRRAALVHDDGKPNVPDLFWAVADRWKPEFTHLGGDLIRALHGPSARDLGVFGNIDEVGWALTGPLAAARFGAPITVSSDTPPSFYVPDKVTLSRAIRRFGLAAPEARSCSIAVAPVVAVCVPRLASDTTVEALLGEGASSADLPSTDRFLATRPLFVALELANDRARGHEILEDWTPSGGTRVW